MPFAEQRMLNVIGISVGVLVRVLGVVCTAIGLPLHGPSYAVYEYDECLDNYFTL